MFKNFFSTVKSKAKELWNRVKNSKVVKVAGKVVKVVCSAAVIVSAFNIGSIQESITHMSDSAITLGDTARWLVVLSKEWIKDIKSKSFTWDVKQIFIPLVIATSYIGGKILKVAGKAGKFLFNAIKNSNTDIGEEKAEPEVQVIDVFA